MMKPPVKQSAYADFLYHKIDEWFIQRGRGFTVEEIAKFAGLKVTGNMRRRLNHSVDAGMLAITYEYNLNIGKIRMHYTKPEWITEYEQ